jgi:hypothetical protein
MINNKKKVIILFLTITIFLVVSACSQQKPKNSKSKEELKDTQIYSNILEINSDLIDIMSQVDLIPYFEKQIKKKKEKEKKPAKKESESSKSSQGDKDQSSSESSSDKSSSGDDQKKFKPDPVTINDILLSKVLEQEKTYQTKKAKERKIPENIVSIWHEINTIINDLHQKWDSLKPKLKKMNVASDIIDDFDTTLNNLTVSSTNEKYMETLIQLNKLSFYLPNFIEKVRNKTLATTYQIKYFVRQIVLNRANNKKNISELIKKIKHSNDIVSTKLEEKKAKDLSKKIKLSIENLKKAVALNDINVIKIKGSILVNDINSATEKILSK